MKIREPTYKRIENGIIERIKFLKLKIKAFNTPLTEKDRKENFKSRFFGDKSVEAFEKYNDELLQREEELNLIRNYAFFHQRNKIEEANK